MKCELCSHEAVYSCDCLVIRHTTVKNSTRIGQTIATNTIKTQSATGVQKVGLCEECLHKKIKENRDHFSSMKTGCLFSLVWIFGLILAMAGIFNMNNTGGIPALRVIGGILIAIGVTVSLVSFCIIEPRKTKQKLLASPHFVFHKVRLQAGQSTDNEGTVELLVPIGKDFYTDKKQFDEVNSLLLPETSQKIYDIIASGRLDSLMEPAPMNNAKNDSLKAGPIDSDIKH